MRARSAAATAFLALAPVDALVTFFTTFVLDATADLVAFLATGFLTFKAFLDFGLATDLPTALLAALAAVAGFLATAFFAAGFFSACLPIHLNRRLE